MKIEIVDERFDPWQSLVDYKKNDLQNNPKIGASSVFLGTKRDFNEDSDVTGMELQHYPGMTEKYLEDIVNTAIKKYKIRMNILIFGGLFSLLLSLILVKYFGIFGTAYTVISTELLLLILGLYFFKKQASKITRESTLE